MCAISGIIGLPAGDQTIQDLWMTMKRRGPDEQGIYQERDITLLHTRLAIIDPEGGKQPMELCWGGEAYVLVYNGELYNTEELRAELIALGHSFQGHSDTEILLHAYAQFGADCIRRINGIYAFAVWEKNRRKLFLARDRIGVKPLFYKEHNGGFLFASEIKTIFAYPGVKAQLDEVGVAQLVLLGPGRLPGSGVWKDLYEVEPGCCGYYENGKWNTWRYWKLMDREHTDSFAQTSEYIRWLVVDAIRRQMVSDMPIGTFLSGGLDSSIITAVCAEEMRKKGAVLNTYSVDYKDSERYFQSNKFQPNQDSDFIKCMQEAQQTAHHWTILSPEDLLAVLEDATIARDLPGMADVDFSLLAFCREIRKDVKVALSGECADEIFGGYPWYRDPDVRSQEGFPWSQNISQRSTLLSGAVSIRPKSFVMDAYRQTCRESDILPGTSMQERRMKEMVNLNFRWFMQTLLDRKDRMSMYHSLEVRVPFCDYRIAEYLYGVPWEYKDYQGQEKGLLRHAMRGYLPDAVLYRKKSPYPKTFDPKYEQLVDTRFRKLLAEESPVWYMLDKSEAERLIDTQMQWPWYGQLMRRPQTMAYFLQLDFWLKQNHAEFCF